MSTYIPSSFNKCYCCLSLRAGVFLYSLYSLTTLYLIEFVTHYAISDYLLDNPEMNAPVPDRYYHFRVPYLKSPVNIFSVIETCTYAIGMVGSYKKSPKLIKYHKNLLFFSVISIPFISIESFWRVSLEWPKINMPDDPDVPEFFERDMKILLALMLAFLVGASGVAYAQQVYAAYVASKYEKCLLLSEEETKEK